MGCQFADGNPVSFEFFGGYIAGSHATFVPHATGELYIQRPWQSVWVAVGISVADTPR
jgi:hypothetical protein